MALLRRSSDWARWDLGAWGSPHEPRNDRLPGWYGAAPSRFRQMMRYEGGDEDAPASSRCNAALGWMMAEFSLDKSSIPWSDFCQPFCQTYRSTIFFRLALTERLNCHNVLLM